MNVTSEFYYSLLHNIFMEKKKKSRKALQEKISLLKNNSLHT